MEANVCRILNTVMGALLVYLVGFRCGSVAMVVMILSVAWMMVEGQRC